MTQYIVNPRTGRKFPDLVGKQFGKWTVVGLQSSGKFTCQCLCGTTRDLLTSVLTHARSKGCKRCSNVTSKDKLHPNGSNLTGRTFGRWIVEGLSPIRRNRSVMWVCRCECGVRKNVAGSSLRSNTSNGCRRCCYNDRFKASTSKHFHAIKNGAKKRGIPFNLTKDFVEKSFDACGGICALSGLPIRRAMSSTGFSRGECTASLDRIDPTKGYTEDNVQWVHKRVNQAKWDITQTDFVNLCALIAQRNGGRADLVDPVRMDRTPDRVKRKRAR